MRFHLQGRLGGLSQISFVRRSGPMASLYEIGAPEHVPGPDEGEAIRSCSGITAEIHRSLELRPSCGLAAEVEEESAIGPGERERQSSPGGPDIPGPRLRINPPGRRERPFR